MVFLLKKISIRQLFENYIILRDLEPRHPDIPGLNVLRKQLDIPENVIPRKNEPDYAKVIEAFVEHISAGKVKNIFYIGDTFFNDGNVVRNIASRNNYNVLGFICNQVQEDRLGEFLLGNIIFSDDWSHLWKLLEEGLKRDFTLSPETIAIFDLDHTVYSAKGRVDKQLKKARLEAVSSLLYEVLGEERYDYQRVQYYYREFDNDAFHCFTKDNQDYVVFLTLVCCLGLTDLEEVRKELNEPGKSIITFIETMRAKVELRKSKEDLEEVWKIIQEIYFNSRLGDQTPCKYFREKEYIATSKYMTIQPLVKEPNDIQNKIVITKEIVEFIQFLTPYGIRAIALSDRPGEATEPEKYGGISQGSILDKEMLIWGNSITNKLVTISGRYNNSKR